MKKGSKHSKEALGKMSKTHKSIGTVPPSRQGKIPWNKNKKLGFIPKKAFKKGQTPWNKGIPYIKIQKENHPNWKGGKTPEALRVRHSLEYKLWRIAVFERDKYTCIWCGDNKGGNLEADHIQKFSDFPELRFAIDNGRTLCVSCHIKRHNKINNLI